MLRLGAAAGTENAGPQPSAISWHPNMLQELDRFRSPSLAEAGAGQKPDLERVEVQQT